MADILADILFLVALNTANKDFAQLPPLIQTSLIMNSDT